MYYVLWEYEDGKKRWTGPYGQPEAEHSARVLLDPEVREFRERTGMAGVPVRQAFVAARIQEGKDL